MSRAPMSRAPCISVNCGKCGRPIACVGS
jgi:hypothetical protein